MKVSSPVPVLLGLVLVLGSCRSAALPVPPPGAPAIQWELSPRRHHAAESLAAVTERTAAELAGLLPALGQERAVVVPQGVGSLVVSLPGASAAEVAEVVTLLEWPVPLGVYVLSQDEGPQVEEARRQLAECIAAQPTAPPAELDLSGVQVQEGATTWRFVRGEEAAAGVERGARPEDFLLVVDEQAPARHFDENDVMAVEPAPGGWRIVLSDERAGALRLWTEAQLGRSLVLTLDGQLMQPPQELTRPIDRSLLLRPFAAAREGPRVARLRLLGLPGHLRSPRPWPVQEAAPPPEVGGPPPQAPADSDAGGADEPAPGAAVEDDSDPGPDAPGGEPDDGGDGRDARGVRRGG